MKLYFFDNKEFLCFLLLKYVILLLAVFFSTCNKTLKRNSKNRKTKKKSHIGTATGFILPIIRAVPRTGPARPRPELQT